MFFNSGKCRHQCFWSVLTDRAALEKKKSTDQIFHELLSQIQGFTLDSESGVTAVRRSDGDPIGDVVGVKKRPQATECGEVFLLLYGTPDANSRQRGSDSQFCAIGWKCPTADRCIVFASAKIKPIFALKAVVSQSFPTSLLPWFLNYDWQGGSVSPSTHSPLEHGSVKLRWTEVDVCKFQNKCLARRLTAIIVYNACC